MWWLKIVTDLPGLLRDGIKAWSAHDQKKQDVDLEKYKVDGKLDEVKVTGEIARLQAIAATQDDTFGGRFMRYVFVYPLGFWWAALIFDSVFQKIFNWRWDVLSAPILEQWGGWIVMYLFLHSTLLQMGRK